MVLKSSEKPNVFIYIYKIYKNILKILKDREQKFKRNNINLDSLSKLISTYFTMYIV